MFSVFIKCKKPLVITSIDAISNKQYTLLDSTKNEVSIFYKRLQDLGLIYYELNGIKYELLNEEDNSVIVSRNFNITEFTYRNNSNAHVVNNKMAPGSSGTFKISVPVKSCIIRSCVGSEWPKISSFSKS